MKTILRAFSPVIIAAALTTLAACGNGGGTSGGGGGDHGSSTGTSEATASGTPSGGSTGTGTGSGIAWSGTWSADATYSVACDFGFSNVKSADWTDTQTLQLSSDGQGGVSAQFPDHGDHHMSGTGNPKGLTLSGQYPAKDDGGATADAVQADNNVTVALTDITDASTASGTITGKFKGQFGQDCTIMSGTITFSR